jgi:hypothetical protein
VPLFGVLANVCGLLPRDELRRSSVQAWGRVGKGRREAGGLKGEREGGNEGAIYFSTSANLASDWKRANLIPLFPRPGQRLHSVASLVEPIPLNRVVRSLAPGFHNGVCQYLCRRVHFRSEEPGLGSVKKQTQ